MPTFMDRHKGASVSEEKMREMHEDVQGGRADKHGVVTKGVLLDKQTDEMICITEGPSEESIRKHHADDGIPVDEIHRVDAIL